MPIFKRQSGKKSKKAEIKSDADEPVLDETASLVEEIVESAGLSTSDSSETQTLDEILLETEEAVQISTTSEETEEEETLAQGTKSTTPQLSDVSTTPLPRRSPEETLIDEIRTTIDNASLGGIERRSDLSEMRLDVARITSDIDSGEALYRRAQQRVENLMSYIEKAEVDFSLLDKLEPENRRLKSQVRTYKSEIENQNARIDVLSASVEDYRTKAQESRAQFDATTSTLAKTNRVLEDTRIEKKRLSDEVTRLSVEIERAKTDKDVEARENRELKTKISQLSVEIGDLKTDKLNLAKAAEALKIDYDDQRTARETANSELSDMRAALGEAQTQNNQFRSELMRVHEEIKNFKTQYEYNILTRDERIIALERKITDLNDKLRHKEEIVASASRDVSTLRKERSAQDIERERLEKTLREQTEKLNSAHNELMRSKQNVDDLDQRYKDAAAALSAAQLQRTARTTVDVPDIRPGTNIDINDYDILPEKNFLEDDTVATEQDDVFKRGIRPAKSSF